MIYYLLIHGTNTDGDLSLVLLRSPLGKQAPEESLHVGSLAEVHTGQSQELRPFQFDMIGTYTYITSLPC